MKKQLHPVLRYAGILAASLLYAAAIALFLDPNQLAPGGVSGIAIILNRLTDLPTGTLILIMNVPLLALGMWKLGWKFVLSTMVAVAASSVFTDLLAQGFRFVQFPLHWVTSYDKCTTSLTQ